MDNPSISEHWLQAKAIFKDRANRGESEYPTGINFIDEITDGIHKGEIWIIAGKAGSGKTTLALQIAQNIAQNPQHTILFLSLEMKGWELVTRIFCRMKEVPYLNLIKGEPIMDFEEKEKDFKNFLNKIDFEIYEFGYSFTEIEAILSDAYKQKHPDIIFIDFIQLIEWKEFGDQRLALMEYIRKLKELAKKLDIAVVICSQLRRLPSGSDYNRPPDLTDLLGSGSLEQTCDKCVFIYKEIKSNDIRYFIKLAKNRQGLTDCKEVHFQGEFYRFSDKVLPIGFADVNKMFNGNIV